MTSVEVYILGQRYTIKGGASAEQIKELARYVEGRLKEVCNSYPNISPLKALILTSFSIAEELYKVKAEEETIAKEMEEKTAALSILFE